MTVRDLHENFDLNIACSIQVFDPELCECARSSDTELEVRHNAILQLDGSASYDPDLADGAQAVGVDAEWACRQDEQVMLDADQGLASDQVRVLLLIS